MVISAVIAAVIVFSVMAATIIQLRRKANAHSNLVLIVHRYWSVREMNYEINPTYARPYYEDHQ